MECRAAGKQRGRAATVDSGVQGRARSKARQQAQATAALAMGGSDSGGTSEAGLGGGAALCRWWHRRQRALGRWCWCVWLRRASSGHGGGSR